MRGVGNIFGSVARVLSGEDKSGSISKNSSLIDLKLGRFPDHVSANIFKYSKSMPSFTTVESIFPAKRIQQVLLVSTKAEFSLDILLRFYLLAEFDDGKQSYRKCLAGHNKRQRKPHTGMHSGYKLFLSFAINVVLNFAYCSSTL
ncbi:hypothetical protein P3S67_022927 [Capsicum chacoense]|uniref:SBP-type domain-containing protein n=1 Tax=Capsicum annuum TaxID=4072 RepID=A0A2G3A5P9_CAPAN|nr:hypothetical protein FXO38_22382 [Capsicum annuum]PHT89566.1 hypothetical protein T459_04679 [Capsicum annuum]